MTMTRREWAGGAWSWVKQRKVRLLVSVLGVCALGSLLWWVVGDNLWSRFWLIAWRPVLVVGSCIGILAFVAFFCKAVYPKWSRWADLFSWVFSGVVVAGVALFVAWKFFHGVAGPSSGASVSPGGSSSGSSMYEVLRTSIAAVGVITVGGGAAIAFRRQKDREEQTEIERHKVELEEGKAELEREKEDRARFADLHARYQHAASQLGDERSMIRVAGVYALEALADEWAGHGNVKQRDVCIDLLCSYLRSQMGVIKERSEVTIQGETTTKVRVSLESSEWDVRNVIAEVLGTHLHKDATSSWSDRSYNFEGATFGKVDFTEAHFGERMFFTDVTVTGNALFRDVTFTGDAGFLDVTFTGPAWFEGAAFAGYAGFLGVTFAGDAVFDGAAFTGFAVFDGVAFTGPAWFEGVAFTGPAWFGGVAFAGNAVFDGAAFTGFARFEGVTFTKDAGFLGVTFTENTWFRRATFKRGVPPELKRFMEPNPEPEPESKSDENVDPEPVEGC